MSQYFARALWAQILRAPAAVLAAGAALTLLTAATPAAQDCTELSAPYLVRRTVVRMQASNGAQIAVPVGQVVAWSCISAAEAEAEAARREAAYE